MANEQNIIPYQFTSEQNRDEASKNGKKGGVASGAARRAKREARETAKLVLDFKPDLPQGVLDTMRRLGMKKSVSPDMRYIATLAIMQKAMKGDVQSYKFIAEMAGETSEASMLDAKAEEVLRRSAYGEETREEAMNADAVRARMSQMTDEELKQYEKMCAMFYDESEGSQ